MANILTQIIGEKEILVFPPSAVCDLDIPPGASSSRITDIFSSALRQKGLNGTLKPGDAIYIPPLWPHATKPLSGNVGVNVFWKNYGDEIYDRGKDVYGNKDLICYTEGRKMLDRIVKGFKDVDGAVREFYMKRLAAELQELAGSGAD
jgi:tRNA wybutosine-synthesizing protein 4